MPGPAAVLIKTMCSPSLTDHLQLRSICCYADTSCREAPSLGELNLIPIRFALCEQMTTTSFRSCTASWPFQMSHVSVQVYFSQFRKTPFGMLRLDPQDAGPGYRNVIGIPGGVNSPLFTALQVLCLLLLPLNIYRILLGLRSYSKLGA